MYIIKEQLLSIPQAERTPFCLCHSPVPERMVRSHRNSQLSFSFWRSRDGKKKSHSSIHMGPLHNGHTSHSLPSSRRSCPLSGAHVEPTGILFTPPLSLMNIIIVLSRILFSSNTDTISPMPLSIRETIAR